MTATNAGDGGVSWAELASLDESQRTDQMASRFAEILSLGEEERPSRLDNMIREVTKVSDDDMAKLSRSRLNAWLAMDYKDAKQFALEFQEAMDRTPGPIAMKHATLDQTVSLDYSHEQLVQLTKLDPKVFRSAPSVGFERPATEVAPEGDPKAWWRFW